LAKPIMIDGAPESTSSSTREIKSGHSSNYYDSLGNIAREEYYTDLGKLTKAFDYHYEDGKWMSKRADSLFERTPHSKTLISTLRFFAISRSKLVVGNFICVLL